MQRLLLALVAALVLVLAGSAAAEAQCRSQFEPGDYVVIDGEGGYVNQPGYVLGPLSACRWEVRPVYRPDNVASVFPLSIREDYLAPLNGEPPHRNPLGCPYAAGEVIDYNSGRSWYPAEIDNVTADCTVELTYTANGSQQQARSYGTGLDVYRDIRPRQDTAQVAGSCPGQALATVADAEEFSAVKRGVINALIEQTGDPSLKVEFNGIRQGVQFVVQDGTTFYNGHTNALLGETAAPYRIEMRVCSAQTDGRPMQLRSDLFCYVDYFLDFVCSP